MSVPFPEPTAPAGSRAEVFNRYLGYFRGQLAVKLRGLPEQELRRSRLVSGWTPLELLKHLTFVEMRWLEWGFEGHGIADPWGDRRDGRWYVAPDETLDGLLAALDAQAERSSKVIAAHDLSETGKPSERWGGEPPATLERVLFHLLQEYARHLGHLDIVAELTGGPTGE
jgi:uncharacterized damage-inducible protein DinB